MSRAGPDDDAAHYWSYRALLEDKRRGLATIPREKNHGRDFGNSLEKEREDCKTSQKAVAELKRHMAVTLDRNWDRNGVKTPPHAYLYDENRPHFSQKEFADKKKHAQTAIRRPASARPKLSSCSSSSSKDLIRDEVSGDLGKKRSEKDINKLTGGNRRSFEAPTMKMLMQPGGRMERKFDNERAALTERRSSSVPHDSYEVINWKKKFHATKIHERRPQRSQSARDVSRGSSEVDSNGDYHVGRDPYTRSYQGAYPNGSSSEAWPQGRNDPKQSGRYQSQAYFMIDKRRHAAAIDGDLENEKARSRDRNENNDSIYHDEDGFSKSDTARERLKYRSQYALAQHKRRHLCNLYQDGDMPADSQASPRNAYYATSPRMDGLVQQDLFTSHKNLEYGKRGHVVTLNSANSKLKTPRSAASGASSESSCDVGKGISRMMHDHDESKVHTSNVGFALKKKNHATSVHVLPKPVGERAAEEEEEETAVGKASCLDKRRPSNPHQSCKAFELKKKYHQTCIHMTDDSKLHPATLKARSSLHSRPGGQTIPTKDPGVMDSYKELNELKKLHMFEYDPDSRVRPDARPIPTAPVPRNGQWTPQHVCD